MEMFSRQVDTVTRRDKTNKTQELAAALASAHPKIQKMCEEESDDAEAVAKLLEINDSIHRTIERYRLMKSGNVAEANKIAKGALGTSFGVGKNAANELSLIDFDPEPDEAVVGGDTNGSLLESGMAAPAAGGHTSVEDDLLGLSLDPGPGQGLISLGGPAPSSQGPSNMFAGFQQPTSSQQQMATPMASPHPPQPQASPKPNYDAFASLTSALPSSKPSTPQPSLQQQQQQKQVPVDPFAALVSAGSRSSTPSGSRNNPAANHQASLHSLYSQAAASSPKPAVAASAPADDEWNFTSSLPTEPESNTVQAHSSPQGVAIAFQARRQPSNNIHVTASFSNNSMKPITALHFQVAVEKSYSLQLRPQSTRELPAYKKDAAQQEILLSGVPIGAGGKVKMRFKVSYTVDGQTVEEQGNAPSLGIQ